ncbi:Hypothetical protein NTJ_08203 [Nesidiocoris tenuis]|uniref:Uncharacterized protein n=1 Tax=Nesidiocoris tenuis TaxID=355587 RepID=A0ABN7AY19_9HEMI|nr:Hypothetical protein NTJ_08203 [Nesidiocoris tenuis]
MYLGKRKWFQKKLDSSIFTCEAERPYSVSALADGNGGGDAPTNPGQVGIKTSLHRLLCLFRQTDMHTHSICCQSLVFPQSSSLE